MRRHGKRTGQLPNLGIDPPKEPTPAELCPPGEDHNEDDEIAIGERHRIFVRRRWWRGRIIEFAMVHTYLVSGKWVEVARADTCHGEVHLHLFDTRGEEIRREVIAPITNELSVEQGYDACNDRILGQLEADVRRWIDV